MGRKVQSWADSARAFTLLELLVVIAIIAVLASMLVPALGDARQRALETVCKNNLHNQGIAFTLYHNDWDEKYPPAYQWKERLRKYIINMDNFKCPSRPNLPWYYGHGYNVGCPNVDTDLHPDVAPFDGLAGARLSAVSGVGYKILIVEWDRCVAGPPVGKKGLFRGGALSYWAVCRVHRNGSNILFDDGHVEWMLPEQYHSNTQKADDSGNPVPSDPVIVDEEVWRSFWDPSY